MKLFKTIILSFLTLSLFAQNDCINNISTNPSAPQNDALPITILSNPNSDLRYLNSFDWTTINNIQLQNMQINQSMLYLHNASAPYYNYIYEGEEMTISNGWELMLLNTGFYPNQTNNVNGQNPDIPYIVLYNKFTGVLRVFAVYGDGYLPNGISFDGVRVSVEFDNVLGNVNGNLRLFESKDKALDKETSSLQTQALAFHPNSPSKWFSVDFQLAYDPCICYKPSNLRLRFDFLTSFSLSLYGRSISVTDNIANGSNLLTNNFLTNFNFNGTITNDQIVMYKVMSTFVDDYISKLEKYKQDLSDVNEINAEIERKLAIIKMFKSIIVEGGSYTLGAMVGLPWFPKAVQYASELIPTLNSDEKALKKYREKLESESKKIISAGVDLYIQKNLQKKPLPNKPNAPVASFTEMNMQGTIGQATPIFGSKFFTPGSYGTIGTGSPVIINSLEYPIYNNPVGTFALLNSPKVNIFKKSEIKNNYNYLDLDQYFYADYTSWDRQYQFQLDEPLKYTFNPSADIKSYTLSVAFELEGDINGYYNGHPISLYIDPNLTTNMNSLAGDANKYSPLKVFDGKGFNNGSNYCTEPSSGQCDYISNNVGAATINIDKIIFNSEYFPVDAVKSSVFGAGIINQCFQYDDGVFQITPIGLTNGYDLVNLKIRMKILIDVTHNSLNDDGTNVKSNFSLTYDVDNLDWQTQPIAINLENSNLNITQFKENLDFKTTIFNGSSIEGCILNGTTYTCQAWNDITINGNLSTSNGYSVNLIAGNQIETFPETVISPEISLSIVPVLDYSQPMPEATPNYVASFCSKQNPAGQNYQADIYNKTALDSLVENQNGVINQIDLAIIKTENELDFQLFPNPSSQLTTVIVEGNESSVTSINILDVMGKEQNLLIEGQNSQFNFDVSSLAKGMYFVKVNTLGASKTKQLIVK